MELQFLRQINAATISLNSGHAPLVSNPNEIAQLILNATNETNDNSSRKR
jgi:hypothetical protein